MGQFLSEIHAVAYAVLLFLFPWKLNIDHDLPEFHSPAHGRCLSIFVFSPDWSPRASSLSGDCRCSRLA